MNRFLQSTIWMACSVQCPAYAHIGASVGGLLRLRLTIRRIGYSLGRCVCVMASGLQTPLGRLCRFDRVCRYFAARNSLVRGTGQLNGKRNQAFYRLAALGGRLGALEKYQTFPHIQSHQISA